ncbi:MAG: hypothetical protein ABI947_29235 [Chloroflexota bacterium]
MLTEPTTLRVLYTASLGGRLAVLPKLMTAIRQERATSAGPALLVDLGRSCAADTWICKATDGRGMLVAMDAMGYDAFHIGAADPLYTQPGIVSQLRDVIQTPLAAGPWSGVVRRTGMVFGFAARFDVRPATDDPLDLMIALQLSKYAQSTVDYDGQLRTLLLDNGLTNEPDPMLGRLDIAMTAEPPYIQILSQTQSPIAADLLPDQTIVSVIEFVESEARYVERKRGIS